MDKIKTDDVIVVEGKYDKMQVANVVDGVIIETDGFAAFSNDELKSMLKTLSKEHNIIILTDPDDAGFKIRTHIASFLPKDRVRHALVPDIYGKEKRKETASKEGKLGVEGIPPEILIDALTKAGVNTTATQTKEKITTSDLFFWGLTGKKGSADRRRALLKALGLPQRTGTQLMLSVLNAAFSKTEIEEKLREISE